MKAVVLNIYPVLLQVCNWWGAIQAHTQAERERIDLSEEVLRGCLLLEDISPKAGEELKSIFGIAFEAGFLDGAHRLRSRLRKIEAPARDVIEVLGELDGLLARLDAAERRRSPPPVRFDGRAEGNVVAFPSGPAGGVA